MRWSPSAWIAGVVLGLGCGPTVTVDGQGSTGGDTTSASEAMTGPPPPGTATTPPNPGTTTVPPDPSTTTGLDGSESSDDDMGFIRRPDGGGPDFECDVFDQDCRPGFKCSPYANDGGSSWNATACFPVVDDPAAIGEPCMAQEHPFSGFDDCGPAAICYVLDEQTLEGTCYGLCIGEPRNPSCEVESHVCALPGDGVGLCLPTCDPLLQDCSRPEACYPVGENFLCAPVDVPGVAGDACQFINACGPGLFCTNPVFVPDCPDNQGCCSSFCSVDDPMPPCLMGQECRPWFDPGQAPPGEELIGFCAVPGA